MYNCTRTLGRVDAILPRQSEKMLGFLQTIFLGLVMFLPIYYGLQNPSRNIHRLQAMVTGVIIIYKIKALL